MKAQLLISSLLVASAASAAFQGAPALSISNNGRLAENTLRFATPALKPVDNTLSTAYLTPATTTIITDVPEGELMTEVIWTSKAAYPNNGKVEWTEVTGFVPTIVTAGKTMYIRNPLTQLSEIATACIRGTISEDGKTVNFATPQAYMINEATPGVPTMLYATRLNGTTGKPDTSSDIIFEFTEDGGMTQTDGGVLGLTDENGNFYGFADMDIKISKINDKVAVLPDNADVHTFEMQYLSGGNASRLSAMIGTSGMDIYFSNPLGYDDSWFVGTLTDDDKVIVHTPQYMGSQSGYPLYLVTGKEVYTTEIDPIFGTPVQVVSYNVTPEVDIIFNYDASTGIYSTDQLIILSSDKDKQGVAAVAVDKVVYKPWTAYAATPAAPSVSTYIDLKEYESFGLFGCISAYVIPAESVDGDFLPQEDIYYTIYFDGKPLEFYGGTLLPYYAQFQDTQTQTALTVSGETHQLQTPLKPEKTIGVQSFYLYNNNPIPSELVEIDITEAGVDGIGVEGKEIAASEYFDMTGRRVAADAAGIVIRRDVMTDGSVRTNKLINRMK